MVGVGKDKTGTYFSQLGGCDGFYRGLGAHWRKYRSQELAMRRVKDASSGTSLTMGYLKSERLLIQVLRRNSGFSQRSMIITSNSPSDIILRGSWVCLAGRGRSLAKNGTIS